MPIRSVIKPSAYFDSVTLMLVQRDVRQLPGIEEAGAVMGTDANKELLRDAGLLTPEAEAARPDDLIFASDLPKTRSGKIMRRLLRDIAEGKALGDTTTLADPAVDIATLALEITEDAERTDPNVVKAICSAVAPGRFRALYFTRTTAPSGEGPLYHHIGLYAYRREALARFVKLPASTLERRERLEQLRALEAGMRIDVALTSNAIFGVDTPEHLEKARRLLASRG